MRVFDGESDELWPARHEFNLEELRASSDPDAFMTHAVELFKEVASLTVLAGATDTTVAAHPRDEAIRRGLLVRLGKLSSSLLNETCAGHGEQQMAIVRQTLETAMNLLYLLGPGRDRYDAFVYDALYAERELSTLIRAAIEERGGTSFPIEDRMLRSIASTAAAAGVDLDDVPPKAQINWPSAYDRMRALDLQHLYVLFRLGSNAIHGGWSEIYLHHLVDEGPGLFRPYFDHLIPRPEPLTATGIVIIVAVANYLMHQDPARAELFEPRLDDLRNRLLTFERTHERYLQSRD